MYKLTQISQSQYHLTPVIVVYIVNLYRVMLLILPLSFSLLLLIVVELLLYHFLCC